ncbi:hypothetical protein ACH42_15850 [Endozoicomonas sp. (ex Bugula neritina AB1)]|nr:hypothetical protein ACH42_15850 [Endozoicomonas sp. (ex Bugula neritina AB1)]
MCRLLTFLVLIFSFNTLSYADSPVTTVYKVVFKKGAEGVAAVTGTVIGVVIEGGSEAYYTVKKAAEEGG